jgi:hypothetical protein
MTGRGGAAQPGADDAPATKAGARAVEALDRLTGALAHGEARAGQREMARRVADAIAGRRHLISRTSSRWC